MPFRSAKQRRYMYRDTRPSRKDGPRSTAREFARLNIERPRGNMYTISGSGCRQVLCSWIKTIVGCVTDAYADYVHYDSFTDTNGVTIPNHTPEKAVGAYAEISGTFDIQSNTCSRLTSLG